MTEVLFHSTHGNLTIQRPTHTGNKDHMGRIEMLGAINFVDGWLKVDDKKDKEVISILENHKGNMVNGGNSFKRMKADILSLKAIEGGNTFACLPDDGLSESDPETFKYLSGLPASLPPNTFNKAMKLAVDIYERYSMVGFPKPSDKFTQKRLKACIVEMIATLEDRGIWNDDIHGEENTGSGSEED